MSIAQGIADTANAIGMRPQDLATIISYETGGTFDPKKAGPTTKWGQHRGLIQFGEPQARKYGVDWQDPINSQLGANGAVAKYFKASGWKPGMDILNAYSIVNAGSPGKFNASDTAAGGAPGTVRDKVQNQFAPHARKAAQLMAGIGGGMDKQQSFDDIFGGTWQPSNRYAPKQADAKPSNDHSDIFGGSWQPSNRYAPKQADAKPSNDHSDIFGGTWQPSNRYAPKQADANPDQGGVVAPSTAGGFNQNPIAARNAAESTVVAPKVDALVALGAGAYRGLKDVGAGLGQLNEKLAAVNPLAIAGDYVTGGARGKANTAIQDWNRADLAEFNQQYGDSKTAGFGRLVGNTVPMMLPGMQGVRAESLLGKAANAMATGGAQSAVIGTGRNPDADIGKQAAIGAAFGLGGTAIGSMLPRAVRSMSGGVRATGDAGAQRVGTSAIERLIKAGAPDVPLDVAAARLQGAIRQGNITHVPGASPTTAQAAMTPGISQTQRDVLNFGQGNLADKLTLQEQARISQLFGVADTTGMTAKDAMQSAGVQIGNQVRASHGAARQATRDLYQSPALQQSVVDTSALGGKLGDIYSRNFTVGGDIFGGNPLLAKAAKVLEGKNALPYQELQNVRSQVAALANDFGADANIRRVAGDMRSQLDDAIDALPGASAAKQARIEQGKKFERGFAGDITGRKGSGEYRLSDDAIAQRLLSPAPGQTARAQGFNAVADQGSKDAAKQALMADMMERSGRSIGTDAQRLLPSQLSGYTNQRAPLMRELLTPDEYAAITAVSKDATRAADAAGLGKAFGSNTAQNQQSALNLGLLDSPVVNFVAQKVPLGSAVIDPIRQYQKQGLATELGKLLSDPNLTDDAITQFVKAMRTNARAGRAGVVGGVAAGQAIQP